MKTVVVSFYYPPDLSAGAFRAAALVEALLRQGPPVSRITVLTSTPNRYATHQPSSYSRPTDERVSVHRSRVTEHRSGIADQARTFAEFARSAYQYAGNLNPDVIVATSSRLFTASLGAAIAIRLDRPLYLDLRDVFSETVGDVFDGRASRIFLPAIHALERWTLRRARRINVVSPAFIDYFSPAVGHRDFAQFTNGVDDLFLSSPALPVSIQATGPPVVLTAGNIGEGQGLHHILPSLAGYFPKVRFRVIGDGSRRQALAEAIGRAKVANVELVPPIPRDQLIKEYEGASVLFVHLNDLSAFKRVLPSKLFEYAATGLPILAGVSGFARDFIDENLDGVAAFNPCDLEGARAGLASLLNSPPNFDRSDFRARFARSRIMDAMARDIISVAGF